MSYSTVIDSLPYAAMYVRDRACVCMCVCICFYALCRGMGRHPTKAVSYLVGLLFPTCYTLYTSWLHPDGGCLAVKSTIRFTFFSVRLLHLRTRTHINTHRSFLFCFWWSRSRGKKAASKVIRTIFWTDLRKPVGGGLKQAVRTIGFNTIKKALTE